MTILACGLGGCGSDAVEQTPLDKEACDIFESGDITMIDAVPIGGTPPQVYDDGRQYKVTLPPLNGTRGGRVLFEVDTARTFVFFADGLVSVILREGEATGQGPDPGQGRLNTCPLTETRLEFSLEPGTYFVEIGPTNLPGVGVAVLRK